MEEGMIALPLSAITTLVVGVIGFFLKGAMADLKEDKRQLDDLKMRIVVLEQRDSAITQLQADVNAMRGDIMWVREKLAGLVSRDTAAHGA